jgi:peptidyl-prolyl cis-trans isomerase C
MKMKSAVLAAALAALPLAGLAQSKGAPRGEAIATVNGVAVPKSRFDFLMEQNKQRGMPDNEQTRAQVRDELISREIMSKEASRAGHAKSQEVQQQLDVARQEILINAYLRDYVRKNPVSDADIQKEYERVKAQTGGKEYKARHILVETEDQAKGLIADLKRGSKFEDLASKNSKDPGTKDRGGDLDWNVPGVFDKGFSDAMVALDKGKYTETPARTRFGFHVIRLDDVRDVKYPPLNEARPQLQQRLTQMKIDELLRGLRAKAKVE